MSAGQQTEVERVSAELREAYLHMAVSAFRRIGIEVIDSGHLWSEDGNFRTMEEYQFFRQALRVRTQGVAEAKAVELAGGAYAPCPLCGELPVPSPYTKPGWKLPLGLDRHLDGSGGNTEQCVIWRALDRLLMPIFHKLYAASTAQAGGARR